MGTASKMPQKKIPVETLSFHRYFLLRPVLLIFSTRYNNRIRGFFSHGLQDEAQQQ